MKLFLLAALASSTSLAAYTAPIYLPRDPQPLARPNMAPCFVGRYGDMPIPSGQRRKLKKYKRNVR